MRDSINEPFEIFATQTPTATLNSADFQNFGARGLEIYLDVSGFVSGSITDVLLQTKSPNATGGALYQTLTSFSTLAIGANGLFQFLVYPCASLATGGYKAAPAIGILPIYFRIQMLSSSPVLTAHMTGVFRG